MYLPIALVIVFSLPLLSDSFRADAVEKLDVIGKLSAFLGVLTGFFIAALAAVATFGKTEMDDPMPGDPPLRLEHKINKETFFENLTRRRFLSLLFGYLSFLSLTLYVIGYGYTVVDGYFVSSLAKTTREAVFSIFWIFYMFWIANILSNTYLGLFYLSDRIHRPNKAPVWGSDDKPK